MNKQELIDKAVEDLKGVLRNHKDYWFENGEMWLYFPEGSFDRLQLCTTDEFTQRARELGWINGYKWGVEYPTNGKKPDLDDDVELEIFSTADGQWNLGNVGIWNFAAQTITAFRIVDERYKTMSKSEPEMSKECLNDFPFIGCLAEHISWGMPIKIKFLGERLFVAEKTDASIGADREVCGFIRDLRPIKTDREKFVDAALAVMQTKRISNTQRKTINRLYEAGFRAPE